MNDANVSIQATTECIKTVQHFGYNTYYNICNHSAPVNIPWGVMDWLGIVLVLAVLVFSARILFSIRRGL